MWKYVLAWFPMVVVAIANGLFREKIIAKFFNELQSHQLSTLTMIILFGIYVWVIFKLWLPGSSKQTMYIGLLWLVLTVIFEFLFGHYVVGHSWDKLLYDYDILKGRLWVIVLFWIAIAPNVIFRLQKLF